MKRSIIFKTKNDQKIIHLKDRIKEIENFDEWKSEISTPEEIEIPPGVSIKLYGEKYFNRNSAGAKNGKEIIFDSGNQYYLIDILKDLGFEIKSLIAYSQNPVALLYTRPNFKGDIIPIYQDISQNGTRSIQIPSIKRLLKNYSVKSDQIQSIQLSSNLGLILYQEEHFDHSAILNLSKNYHPSELILPKKVFSVIVGHLSTIPKPVNSIQGGPISSFIQLKNLKNNDLKNLNNNDLKNLKNNDLKNLNNNDLKNLNNNNLKNNDLKNDDLKNLKNNSNNLKNNNLDKNDMIPQTNLNYLLIFLFIIVIAAIIWYLFKSLDP